MFSLSGITEKKKTIRLTDETKALGKWYKTHPSPSGTRYTECKSAKEVAHARAAKQKRKKAAKKLPAGRGKGGETAVDLKVQSKPLRAGKLKRILSFGRRPGAKSQPAQVMT